MFNGKLKEELAQLKEELNRKVELIKSKDRTIDELTKKITEYDRAYEEKKAIAYKTMDLEYKEKLMNEVSALKDKHQAEMNALKSEMDGKLSRGLEENFSKMKDSLAKIHEEGNANTKYIEQASLKMMDVFAQMSGRPVKSIKAEN